MNGFVILSFSTLVCFLCQSLDQAFCDTAGSFYRHPNKTPTYAIFKNHSFHDLDVPKVDEDVVETERKCLLRCEQNFPCLSANIEAFCACCYPQTNTAHQKRSEPATLHHYSIVVKSFTVFCLFCEFVRRRKDASLSVHESLRQILRSSWRENAFLK